MHTWVGCRNKMVELVFFSGVKYFQTLTQLYEIVPRFIISPWDPRSLKPIITMIMRGANSNTPTNYFWVYETLSYCICLSSLGCLLLRIVKSDSLHSAPDLPPGQNMCVSFCSWRWSSWPCEETRANFKRTDAPWLFWYCNKNEMQRNDIYFSILKMTYFLVVNCL